MVPPLAVICYRVFEDRDLYSKVPRGILPEGWRGFETELVFITLQFQLGVSRGLSVREEADWSPGSQLVFPVVWVSRGVAGF